MVGSVSSKGLVFCLFLASVPGILSCTSSDSKKNFDDQAGRAVAQSGDYDPDFDATAFATPGVFADNADPVTSPQILKTPMSQSVVQDQLRIGEAKLGGPDSNERILVLGADVSHGINIRFKTDLTELRRKDETGRNLEPVFSGSVNNSQLNNDIRAIDPKFLLTVNKEGVQSIRSFEVGGPNRYLGLLKRIFTGRGADKRAGLPPELVNVSHAKRQLATEDAINLVLTYLPVPPQASPALAAIRIIRKEGENKKIEYATYLESIIEGFLNPLNQGERYGVLNQFLTVEQIKKMGLALAVRYNRNSPYMGLFKKDNEQWISYFDSYLQAQESNWHENLDFLNRRANENNLVVIPFPQSGKALLFASTDENFDPVLPMSNFLLPTITGAKLQEYIKSYKFRQGSLVPLGIFDFSQKGASLELVDLTRPNYIAIRQRVNTFLAAAALVAKQSLLTAPQSAMLSFGEGVLKFTFTKFGKNQLFQDRIRSYGQMAALLEMGTFDSLGADGKTIHNNQGVAVNWDEIGGEGLLAMLGAWGFTDDEISRYRSVYKCLSDNAVGKQDVCATLTQSAQIPTMADWYREILGDVTRAEQEKGTLFGLRQRDRLVKNKSINMKRLANVFTNAKDEVKLRNQLAGAVPHSDADKNANREPGAEKAVPKSGLHPEPVITFLVDGLRPDRLTELFDDCDKATDPQTCLVPTMRQMFRDNGVQLNSFTSRSLTLPSWATILTGMDPDYHGLRSNSPVEVEGLDKSGKVKRDAVFTISDLSDPRYEIITALAVRPSGTNYTGRAKHRLQENGAKFINEHVGRDNYYTNLTPVNGDYLFAIADLGRGVVRDFIKSSFVGKIKGGVLLDTGSADRTARDILKDAAFGESGAQYRVVTNWYASIDEQEHHANSELNDSYRAIDYSIKTVIDAARQHPILKRAKLILVSDHGHSGGFERGPANSFFTEKHYMNNTGFNLVTMFAGDNRNFADYQFKVTTAESPEPYNDMLFLREFMISPIRTNYCGKPDKSHCMNPAVNNARRVRALVDYQGDKTAQLYFENADDKKRGAGETRARHTFHDLTHFDNGYGKSLDLISDLFRAQSTIVSTGPVAQKIQEVNGGKVARSGVLSGHVVKFLAMALTSKSTCPSMLEKLDSLAKSGRSTREPVLLMSQEGSKRKQALIYTREESTGDSFRYLVLSSFEQDKNGCVTATTSIDPIDDPLDYLNAGAVAEGKGLTIADLDVWHSETEWLARTQYTIYPTAIFAIPKLATVSSQLEINEESKSVAYRRKSEIPDLIAISGWGFAFHNDYGQESDHGGLLAEEVKNTFYVSDIKGEEGAFGKGFPAAQRYVKTPVLNRDVLQTILDFAAIDGVTKGRSIRPYLNERK